MNRIRRRRFLLCAGTLIVAPSTLAQKPERTYNVGMIVPVSAAGIAPYRAALGERLAHHGFVEGRNLKIDARSAADSFHEDRQTIRDLLGAKPDALFTCFTGITLTALSTTKTTPIVFAWVSDPVVAGIVKSLAAPGRNATGVTNRAGELHAKRVELALELVPDAKRIAMIGGGTGPMWEAQYVDAQEVATARGIELLRVFFGASVEGAVSDAAEQGAQAALFMFPYVYAPVGTEVGIRVTREKRIPAIFMDAAAVEGGALISLGTNFLEDIRRGADLLAKVLRGENPARLPVDQAARFELALNLKTARDIGVKIPQSILLRADKVIE